MTDRRKEDRRNGDRRVVNLDPDLLLASGAMEGLNRRARPITVSKWKRFCFYLRGFFGRGYV